MPESSNNLAGRLAGVRARIATAALRAGREPSAVTLIAVGKTHPAELIREAYAAGQRDFGENRIQEALGKFDALADLPLAWHLIGHLQRNKARQAVGRFALIHSVDSVRLIETLESEAARAGIIQPILLQLNLAGEASKFGAAAEDLPALLDALAAAPHLRAGGLMTIPPYDDDPEASRPLFRRLRQMLDSVPPGGPLVPRHLSIGMSNDFEVAVEEGATLVRVGTTIFGER